METINSQYKPHKENCSKNCYIQQLQFEIPNFCKIFLNLNSEIFLKIIVFLSVRGSEVHNGRQRLRDRERDKQKGTKVREIENKKR